LGFIDVGINGQNNADPNFAVFDAGCGYLWTSDSNLYIGTQSNSDGLNQGDINFFTGGTDNKNKIRVNIAKAGPVTFQNGATVTAPNFISNVATGTSPYACTSTTLNTNLNADLLDGKNTGTSGNTVPLLDGSNTHSGTNKFGDGTNCVQIDGSGELTLLGTATVWDDLRVTPGSFDRPGVADPDIVAYDVNGGGVSTYLYEFAKNDVASFVVQLPHSYMQGEDISVHIHWTPGARGNEENGATVGWKVDYSWANIGGNFGTMATADLSDACDGTDHKHQMTPEVTITGSGKNISSMLICNVKRTDTGDDDTWASTTSGQLPMILEIDFHYPINTLGSKTSSAK
jgi:hypothetical protein